MLQNELNKQHPKEVNANKTQNRPNLEKPTTQTTSLIKTGHNSKSFFASLFDFQKIALILPTSTAQFTLQKWQRKLFALTRTYPSQSTDKSSTRC